MTNNEIGKKFSAIVIAIQSNHLNVARQVFDLSIQTAVNEKLDQAIEILKENGEIILSNEIVRLKERETRI